MTRSRVAQEFDAGQAELDRRAQDPGVPPCGLVTCERPGENYIALTDARTRQPVFVFRCRCHTHRLHRLLVGPGEL